MGFLTAPSIKQPRRAEPQAPAEKGRHCRPEAGQGEAGRKVQEVLQVPPGGPSRGPDYRGPGDSRGSLQGRVARRRRVAAPEHGHGGPGLSPQDLQAVQGPDPIPKPRRVQEEKEAEGCQAVPLQFCDEDDDRGMKKQSD